MDGPADGDFVVAVVIPASLTASSGVVVISKGEIESQDEDEEEKEEEDNDNGDEQEDDDL